MERELGWYTGEGAEGISGRETRRMYVVASSELESDGIAGAGEHSRR